MSRQPITRMDIDTRWAYHRKSRALQSRYPRKWPTFWCAFMALLGESWASRQRVTLEDAWLPGLPCPLPEALAALSAVGLVDEEGRIREDSWVEWVEPAIRRIERKSEGGKRGAAAKWGTPPSEGSERADDGWDSHDIPNGIPMGELRHQDAPRLPSQASRPVPSRVRYSGAYGTDSARARSGKG